MKALTKKLLAPVFIGLMLIAGAAMPTKAQDRVQAGVTTVAYGPPVRFYFGVGPPYYYPYGYPYGYWGYHRHWHRW